MLTTLKCPKCNALLKAEYFSHTELTCAECKAELRSNGPILMGITMVVSLPIAFWLYSLIPESIPMVVGLLPLELIVAFAFGIPLGLLLRITAP
jgi:hypothetical protein